KLSCQVSYEPGIRTVPRSFSPLKQGIFWIDVARSVSRMAKLIETSNVRLVHSNSEASLVGGLAAAKGNIPAVSHLRGLSVLSPRGVGHCIAHSLSRYHQVLIAPTESVKRSYVDSGARLELM